MSRSFNLHSTCRVRVSTFASNKLFKYLSKVLIRIQSLQEPNENIKTVGVTNRLCNIKLDLMH